MGLLELGTFFSAPLGGISYIHASVLPRNLRKDNGGFVDQIRRDRVPLRPGENTDTIGSQLPV